MAILFCAVAVVAVTFLRTPNNGAAHQLSIEAILKKNFTANTYTPVWLANGNFLYDYNEFGTRWIIQYNATTLEKEYFLNTSTLIVNGEPYGDAFADFYPSADLSHILFAVQTRKLFRSSFYAKWIVYDRKTQKSEYLLDGAFAANPSWNPNPAMADTLAIVVAHNVVIISQLSSALPQVTNVTSDGSPLVLNGIMDWLYEEEVFESSPALYWSPDGAQLAYLKLNDTLVGEVPYPWFQPVSESVWPSFKTVRYPKSGTTNPTASAHVYTVPSGATSTMQLLPNTEYITSIGWIVTRPGEISVRVLPRVQQVETLLLLNASSGNIVDSVVTQNMSNGWVESRPYSYIWIDRFRFVDIRANGDYYHIALMSIADGPGQVVFLTSGPFAVMSIVGYEPTTSEVYFISTEDGATMRHLYRVNLHGKRHKLTTLTNTNSVYWGPGPIYVLEGSSSNIPPQQWVSKKDTGNAHQHLIVENSWLTTKLSTYNVPKKKFTQVPGAHGDMLNVLLIHPHDALTGVLYPVLFTYYQGPTSARVLDQWSLGFNEWISTRSKMIVVVIDGAGTGGRSISFNQQTFKRLGVRETDDQLAAMNWLLTKRLDMDWNRVACWGWSYGGFMTLSLALRSSNIFNAAISVAPVTDWRLYDTFYTERYMLTPQENEAGYNETSILKLVDLYSNRISIGEQNKTHLYLIHGLADDNVHFQNSAEFVNRMIVKDAPLSMAYYPNQAHSISNNGSLLHLYHGIKFFLKANVIDFLFYDLHPDY